MSLFVLIPWSHLSEGTHLWYRPLNGQLGGLHERWSQTFGPHCIYFFGFRNQRSGSAQVSYLSYKAPLKLFARGIA
ncbi:hypothetical protein COCON_G00063520 [Conger conger]|uniref:Uncharacterized protein n=1 Tax=Conger conger TaxID=82655 RepID=A0A9Q1DRX2_CONCO|nr:hypothetical protein COCON_G00063520 [Conger conger]